MCGIVAAITSHDAMPVLLDGLRRLEYRGYDSAGVALIDKKTDLHRCRSVGRIRDLENSLAELPGVKGSMGIAHTRWATHGPPTVSNAHPHYGGHNIALVCNGIVENYVPLREGLIADGYVFQSETDTEVIVNLVHKFCAQGNDLLAAVQSTIALLEGAYAIAVMRQEEPTRIIGARFGSPMVVGLGNDENFLASDISALIAFTKRFHVLEEGDVVDMNQHQVTFYDRHGDVQQRTEMVSQLNPDTISLGEYRHYMHKEIHEQGRAIADTLEGRVSASRLLPGIFGPEGEDIFAKTKAVQMIACGTSYLAASVAKYWFEQYGVPCQVEIASEFRSRAHAVPEDCLVVTLSQSGETIDTLSALRYAKTLGYRHSLTICNAPESSMVRESDLVFMTHAGPEIGVASTKAYTTQLVALQMLIIAIARHFKLDQAAEQKLISELRMLPGQVEKVLELEPEIQQLAQQFSNKDHALFLGRGNHYPIAQEGALKLKEISYIHAEAYPAGELKHGPLALVDENMPIVAVAPNNEVLDKLKGNLEEVRARGAQLFVFADDAAQIAANDSVTVVNVAPVDAAMAPIIYVIPLQLLAYHVALIKGTDVDKPRNLAKSVTVE